MSEPIAIVTKNKNAFLIDVDKLFIKDRARKEFGPIATLAESISKLGLIQPIVVDENDPEHPGLYVLLAGERRLRACLSLRATKIPVVVRLFATELEQAEIEFDENHHRLKLDWVEEAFLMSRIDKLKKATYGDARVNATRSGVVNPEAWNIKKTAEIFQQDPGHVGKKIRMAEKLALDPLLKKEIQDRGLPLNAAYKLVEQREAAKDMQQRVANGTVKLSTNLRLGSALDLIKDVASASVDLLLWDPPFGVSAIEESEGDGHGTVQTFLKQLKASDNLTLASATELLAKLWPELKRVLKPGATGYIFHSADLYGILTALCKAHEFDYDPSPLIWDKTKSTTPDRGYKYMECYEPILHFSNGPWSRRLLKASKKILPFAPVSSADKSHPFQKPSELLRFLIEQSTDIGQVVLDPTAGSFASIFAAEDLGRISVGFELDQEHFLAAQVWRERREKERAAAEIKAKFVALKGA